MRPISRRDLLTAGSTLGLMSCARIPVRSVRAPPRSVVVIGGGLAGLSAAYELLKLGFDVRLLEAQAQPGGRIRTLRNFPEGLYVEAGATHVVGEPDLLALISELGVELTRAPRASWPRRVLFKNGVRTVVDAAAELPDDAPPLRQDEAALEFDALLAKYFGSPKELDPRTTDWSRPDLAALDGIDAQRLLIDLGASEGFKHLAESFAPSGSLQTMSALAMIREALNFQLEIGWSSVKRVAGGCDHLPRALAQKLGQRLLLGAQALRIDQDAHGATVTYTRNGQTDRLSAAQVICALPGTLVHRLAMSPGLPMAQREAFSRVNSVSVSHVYATTRTRFWNARGESGNVETDLPLGQLRDESALQQSTAGILGAHPKAAESRRWNSLAQDALHREVLAAMGRVHPGLEEQLVSVQSVRWDEDPLIRGAFTWLAPGQLTQQQPLLRAAHGVVQFAGDYNSHRPGFMHGALASAKRAVAAVVSQAAKNAG